MTRLEHVLELVGDLRDCASRARDLGIEDWPAKISHVADEIEHRSRKVERPSLPPVLASNQEARATAAALFRRSREILKGIR